MEKDIPVLVRETIAKLIGANPSHISLDARFREDIQIDRMTFLELIWRLMGEINYSISLDEAIKAETVEDLIKVVSSAHEEGWPNETKISIAVLHSVATLFGDGDASHIALTMRFREDLDVDEIMYPQLIFMIEDRLGFEIPDYVAYRATTVGDLINLTTLYLAWPTPHTSRLASNYDYDIAISYASEDRRTAEDLAKALTEEKINVFYDQNADIQASIWGKDLYTYFAELFSKRARYCLVIISENYVRKTWTRHELRAAQERALIDSAESKEYILPLRLDDTKVPGIFSTTGYVDARTISANTLVKYLVAKLKS